MFNKDQQLGEYTLIEKLGQGGFGEVWLAENSDEPFSRFAIKLPFKDQVDWKQITQEIGLWTLCGKHANILPLIGAKNINGQIAIVSEYAPDGSLEDLLQSKGRLDQREAIAMIVGILRGLQHLHESGIIHRDLKPANILLNGSTPRLTDFGISRLVGNDSLSETISGTWAYMAPECFDGRRNVQTDIWACGVILYRMLSGGLPFPRKERTALVASIIMSEPEPYPFGLSQPLLGIIATSLNKKGGQRYSSSAQMVNDLERVFEVPEYYVCRTLLDQIDSRTCYKRDPSPGKLFELPALIPFRSGDKWGFCDQSSSLVINPKYSSARPFKDGFSFVEIGEKQGFVDENGNEYFLKPVPAQQTFVDRDGNELIPSRYDFCGDFYDGLARVKLDGTWRYIDTSANEVFAFGHEYEIRDFDNCLAYIEHDGRFGFVDTSGRISIPLKYENIYREHQDAKIFLDGLARVRSNGKYGFIDFNGEEVIPLIYDNVSYVEGDAIRIVENGKYGVINFANTRKVEPKYDFLCEFSEGLTAAKLGETWGFIDEEGEVRVDFDLEAAPQPFKEGLALVKRKGRLAYVDEFNNVEFSVDYDSADSFSEGMARVSVNGKYGFVDQLALEIVEPKYQQVSCFLFGSAIVKLDDRYGLIDCRGDEIVEPIYDYMHRDDDGLILCTVG